MPFKESWIQAGLWILFNHVQLLEKPNNKGFTQSREEAKFLLLGVSSALMRKMKKLLSELQIIICALACCKQVCGYFSVISFFSRSWTIKKQVKVVLE